MKIGPDIQIYINGVHYPVDHIEDVKRLYGILELYKVCMLHNFDPHLVIGPLLRRPEAPADSSSRATSACPAPDDPLLHPAIYRENEIEEEAHDAPTTQPKQD